MAKEIIIEGGDPATQKLILSTGERTKVDKGQSIKWKIGDRVTTVASIEKIDPKSGSSFRIFSEHPGKEDSRKWKGKIKGDAADYDQCRYNIHWKADAGSHTTYTHDPIISIKPSSRPGLHQIILLAAAAVFGIFMYKFLRNKYKNSRKSLPARKVGP